MNSLALNNDEEYLICYHCSSLMVVTVLRNNTCSVNGFDD